MRAIAWLADWLLAYLQRRCEHPGMMVVVDVLEGCVDGLEVQHCRRCGAIKVEWSHGATSSNSFWRRPDPFLWRGR